MIRPEVARLVELGPWPSSQAVSPEEVDERLGLLQRASRPVTLDEARALIKLFGPDDFFGVVWELISLIESAPGWPSGVDLQGDQEWVELLRIRARNAGLI